MTKYIKPAIEYNPMFFMQIIDAFLVLTDPDSSIVNPAHIHITNAPHNRNEKLLTTKASSDVKAANAETLPNNVRTQTNTSFQGVDQGRWLNLNRKFIQHLSFALVYVIMSTHNEPNRFADVPANSIEILVTSMRNAQYLESRIYLSFAETRQYSGIARKFNTLH